MTPTPTLQPGLQRESAGPVQIILLVVAAVLSILLHIAGVITAGDRSIGQFQGPGQLKNTDRTVSVTRQNDDWLTQAPPTMPEAPTVAPEPMAPTMPEPDELLPEPPDSELLASLDEPLDPLSGFPLDTNPERSPANDPMPTPEPLPQVDNDPALSDLPATDQTSQQNRDLLSALQAANIEGLAMHQPDEIQLTDDPIDLQPGRGGNRTAQRTTPNVLDPTQAALQEPDLPAIPNPQGPTPRMDDPGLNALAEALPPPPTLSDRDTQPTADQILSGMDLPASSRLDLDTPLATDADWLPPITLDDAFDYHVEKHLSRTPPHHFSVKISPRPRELQVVDPMPKDVIFLLDTSSSIAKSIVREVFDGVSRGLDGLNPQDRFNIAVFNQSTQLYSRRLWAPATAENKANAKAFLQRIDPGGSHTDVNQALSSLLNQTEKNPSRVMNVIVISDGKPTEGVTDSKLLINEITRRNQRIASVYCVSITRNPNTFLMDYLAYRNGGRNISATDSSEVADAVVGLCMQLKDPLIRDVSLQVIGSGAREVYPVELGDIYQGQPFSIFGQFNEEGPFTIHIAGTGLKDGQIQPVDFTFVRDLRQSPDGPDEIEDQWGFWKLHHLYSEQIRLGNDPAIESDIQWLERTNRLRAPRH